MRSSALTPLTKVAAVFFFGAIAFAQTPAPTESDMVRVNVTINTDGSRTVYEFDPPHRRAIATTRERDGKMRGKIEYELDENSRFASGRIFGPEGNFLFRTVYKYNAAGRMESETKIGKDEALLSKIVYNYDKTGRQTGYSIFDAAGKLIGRTASPTPTPSKRRTQR
jgi:hypothetical protein